MKQLRLLWILVIGVLALAGCGKNDSGELDDSVDSGEEQVKLSPEEQRYIDGGLPFIEAIVGQKYAEAFTLLSPHALKKMSLNQFVPPLDDAEFEKNERFAQLDVTSEQFQQFMAKLETEFGAPNRLLELYIQSTDSAELAGLDEPINVMFAIGNMPKSIPTDIRKASLRGQIGTKLGSDLLAAVAKDFGQTVEELQNDPDFSPYFTIKLVLVEEEGNLKVGYFEFLPPSMFD